MNRNIYYPMMKMLKPVLLIPFIFLVKSFTVQGSQIVKHDEIFRYTGDNYSLEWTAIDDKFIISDEKGLIMATGKFQPAIMVKQVEINTTVRGSGGKIARCEIKTDELQVYYEGANNGASVHLTIKCTNKSIWIDHQKHVA